MNESPREKSRSPGVDRVTLELNTDRSEECDHQPLEPHTDSRLRKMNTDGGEPRTFKVKAKTPNSAFLTKFTFPDNEDVTLHDDAAPTPVLGKLGTRINSEGQPNRDAVISGPEQPVITESSEAIYGEPMALADLALIGRNGFSTFKKVRPIELQSGEIGRDSDNEEEEDQSEWPTLALTKAKSSFPKIGKLQSRRGTGPSLQAAGKLEYRASEPVNSLAELAREVSKEVPLMKIVWKKVNPDGAASVDQYASISEAIKQLYKSPSMKRLGSARTSANPGQSLSQLDNTEDIEPIVYPPEVRDFPYYKQVYKSGIECYSAVESTDNQERAELFEYVYKLKTSHLQTMDEYNKRKAELLAKLKSSSEGGSGARSVVLKSAAFAFASLLESKKQKLSSSLLVSKEADLEATGGRSSTVVTDEGQNYKDYIPVIDNLANTCCSNLVNIMDKSSAVSKEGLSSSVVRIGTVELPGLLPLLSSLGKSSLRFATKNIGDLADRPSNLEQNENVKKLLSEELSKCFGSLIPVLKSASSAEHFQVKREVSREQRSNFTILGVTQHFKIEENLNLIQASRDKRGWNNIKKGFIPDNDEASYTPFGLGSNMEHRFTCAKFSPDGNYLALGKVNGDVQILQTHNDECHSDVFQRAAILLSRDFAESNSVVDFAWSVVSY